MSGQYPPPNPAHPYNRMRAPSSQRLLPPWGHTAQSTGLNMVGSSMNFYNSPHMGLPSRGAQPWMPRAHPKPSDTLPGSTNPLFGLQMLMTPDSGQRIPSEYQQEETMDLSSHSSVPPVVAEDVPKIMSARSENSDLLRNGTVLTTEVNGELDRTVEPQPEVKDSVLTSVIAPNPLRENNDVSDPLNFTKVTSENSVLKRVESPDLPEPTEVALTNPQSSSCVTSDNFVVNKNLSEPVSNNAVTLVLKTAVSSNEASISEEVNSDLNSDNLLSEKNEMIPEKNFKENLDILNKNDNSEGDSQNNEYLHKPEELQSSFLENSSLSVDTDESKLVVAETSAEDIFGISPVGNPTSSNSQEKTSDSGDKCQDIAKTNSQGGSEISVLNEKLSSTNNTAPPTVPETEPQPSVENVEILLESMFNSQEETSCSSQNSNSNMPQSVIVSSNIKTSAIIARPQVELVSPMKVEDLASTLAEDNLEQTEIKEKTEKITDDVMNEIEKKLEMLTESSLSEVTKSEDQAESDKIIPELLKKEPDIDKEVLKKTLDIAFEACKNEPSSEIAEEKLSEIEDTKPLIKTEATTSSNPFIEVETELEKMFAGIVETTDEVGSDNQSQPSASETKRPVVNKRTVTKRKKANSRRPSDNSVFGGGSSGESTPIKKKGRKRANESGSEKPSKKLKIESGDILKKGRISKDLSSDSLNSKVKGPFVHIKGSKESPASVVVVNSGVRADDDDVLDKINARRKHSTVQRTEGTSRRKGPAYSSSTLSMRYNSDTADLSWVCVFCKRGPHCEEGLGGKPAGDLFGPYRIPISPPGDDPAPPGTPSDRDVVEEQKKRGGKFPKSLRTSGGTDHFIQKMSKKSKRTLSSDCVASPGLLLVDGGYEVWLHGLCAEWAPGLCVIGTQLVGLDDAVWTAVRTKCSQCGETGAGIGCVMRNCPARAHYPCAVVSGWLLDEDNFIARCHTHRTRMRPS